MSGASPSRSGWSDELDLSRLAAWVAADRESPLTWADRSAPAGWIGRTPASFSPDQAPGEGAPGDSALLPTPCLTLSQRALQADVTGFAAWAASHGLAHAPHGKTSMAPALWLHQFRAGAWGLTLANETQLRVAHAVGVPRVVVANLLLRPVGLHWLASVLDEIEVCCWVDSIEAVGLMDRVLSSSPTASGRSAVVRVLVELGSGRTGARSVDDGIRVAEAVAASQHLSLVGVSGYEGVITHDTGPDDIAAVRAFLTDMVTLLDRTRHLMAVEQPILTAGGSTWFDLVSEVFGRTRPDTLVVVRAGSVVTHDDGTYLHSTPAARGADGPDLSPALHAWARVIARPEPTRVILDAGKRDLPYDSGLPVVQCAVIGGEFVALPGHTLIDTFDQHAIVEVPADSPLRVGTVVRMGISHPCTAFDKWRIVPVLDDADDLSAQVVDWVRTYF